VRNVIAPVLLALAGTACPLAAGAPLRDFDCVIEPRQIVEIRSPVAGLIAAVPVKRGDPVRAGQVLVEIDAALDRAALEVAAFRAAMQAPERTAEARVAYSRAKAERTAALAGEKFISDQERDNAQAEQRLAEAELDEVRENTALARLEHRRLQEQVRLRSLRAPVDGVVLERLMHPGDLAGLGEAAKPILRLADISVLQVEVLLPVAAWDRIRPGQTVQVQPDLPRAGRVAARVSAVDRVFDAASGTFGVRLELPNPGGRLPAGVRCKAGFADIDPAPARPAGTAPK
jgi:RND family efflux transporter MFP subunit